MCEQEFIRLLGAKFGGGWEGVQGVEVLTGLLDTDLIFPEKISWFFFSTLTSHGA